MKVNGGFTLLEVLLALVILAGAVSIFSRLHLSSVDRVLISREEIDRIYLISKYLSDINLNPPKKDKPIVNTLEKPEVKITAQFLDIEKKSQLNEFKDVIRIAQAEGEWKSGADQRSLTVVSFAKKPQEEKKK